MGQRAGASSPSRTAWASSSRTIGSTFEDLVQYNDGFRTKLIGTPEQIAERLFAYKQRGVNLSLLGFLHYLEDIAYFGEKVLPLVRELERAEQLTPSV